MITSLLSIIFIFERRIIDIISTITNIVFGIGLYLYYIGKIKYGIICISVGLLFRVFQHDFLGTGVFDTPSFWILLVVWLYMMLQRD